MTTGVRQPGKPITFLNFFLTNTRFFVLFLTVSDIFSDTGGREDYDRFVGDVVFLVVNED